jgi:hypothetical protein
MLGVQAADKSYQEENKMNQHNLNSQITLSHPELFCLPAVAPDDFEALIDGFLA